jgi:hypothetical protein
VDARAEFEISERSPKKLVVQQAVQGGNINASDAPPASTERKISEPSNIAGLGYFVYHTSRGGV